MIPGRDQEERLPQVLRLAGHAGGAQQEVPLHRLHHGRRQGLRPGPMGAVPGFLYNKRSGSEAGDHRLAHHARPSSSPGSRPSSPRPTRVPYYTNFKDRWPLTHWTYINGSVSCDPQATTRLAEGNPWAEDADLRVGDTLLLRHRARRARSRRTRRPPTGRIQAPVGEGRDRHDVARLLGGHPVPGGGEEGRQRPRRHRLHALPGPGGRQVLRDHVADYNQAVNIHSEHKEAARAWIDWFTDKSGYADDNLALSPVKDAPLPGVLKPYEAAGVKLIELDDAAGRGGQGHRQPVGGRHLQARLPPGPRRPRPRRQGRQPRRLPGRPRQALDRGGEDRGVLMPHT